MSSSNLIPLVSAPPSVVLRPRASSSLGAVRETNAQPHLRTPRESWENHGELRRQSPVNLFQQVVQGMIKDAEV